MIFFIVKNYHQDLVKANILVSLYKFKTFIINTQKINKFHILLKEI